MKVKVQKIADEEFLFFFLRGGGHAKATFSCLASRTFNFFRISCPSDIIAKVGGFEVEIELNGFDCTVAGEICAFK